MILTLIGKNKLIQTVKRIFRKGSNVRCYSTRLNIIPQNHDYKQRVTGKIIILTDMCLRNKLTKPSYLTFCNMPKVYSGGLSNIFSQLGRMNLNESIVLTQFKNQFRMDQTKNYNKHNLNI